MCEMTEFVHETEELKEKKKSEVLSLNETAKDQ